MKKYLLLSLLWLNTLAISQTNWYTVSTNVNNQLNCIDFPTPSVGYIGGNDTLLLKSIDSGQTWQRVSMNGLNLFPGGVHVLDLQFLTQDIGYMVVGPYGNTYKTTNGGLDWAQLTVSGNLCFADAVYFTAIDSGFIGGSGCFQGELIDIIGASGNTAANVEFSWNPDDIISDFTFNNNGIGLASSMGGRVYRSVDNGQSWDSITVWGAGKITCVQFLNDTLVYAGHANNGSNSNGVFRSEDAGQTWNVDGNTSSFSYPDYFAMTYSNSGKLFVGAKPSLGSAGLILEVLNNTAYFVEVDQPIYGMTSLMDSLTWAVGDSGYVVVNQPPSNLAIEDEQELNINVYPNPAEDWAQLETDQTVEKFVLLNSIGQTVKFNWQENAYGYQLNLTDLPAGLYFLKVQVNQGIKTIPVYTH